SGLAAGAVIGFVFRVHDSLHGCATVGARLAEAAVDRHLRPEGSYLGWKSTSRFLAQPERPLGQHRLRGGIQAQHLAGIELMRLSDRREPRTMQDLVRIGIADAAKEPRVG